MPAIYRLLILIIIPFSQTTAAKAELKDFLFGPNLVELKYVEDFYKLYTLGTGSTAIFQQEQIRFLHLAAQAKFAGIHGALAEIRTRHEYRQYQYMIYFRLAYLLTQSYLRYGARYDKPDVIWTDLEYKDIWQKTFSRALVYYRMAHYYWNKTLYFARKAYQGRMTVVKGGEMASISSEIACVIEAQLRTTLNRRNLQTHDRTKYLDCRIGTYLDRRVLDLHRKAAELGVKLEDPVAGTKRRAEEFKALAEADLF